MMAQTPLIERTLVGKAQPVSMGKVDQAQAALRPSSPYFPQHPPPGTTPCSGAQPSRSDPQSGLKGVRIERQGAINLKTVAHVCRGGKPTAVPLKPEHYDFFVFFDVKNWPAQRP